MYMDREECNGKDIEYQGGKYDRRGRGEREGKKNEPY